MITTTEKKTIVARLEEYITENLKPLDTDQMYDDMLDECYSLESVGGPFGHMSASRVLKEVDPVAYRCGKNDWADGEGWVEINGSEYNGDEVEEQREAFVDTLESELADAEDDLEEKEADGDLRDGTEDADAIINEVRQTIATLQADIKAAKKHVF